MTEAIRTYEVTIYLNVGNGRFLSLEPTDAITEAAMFRFAAVAPEHAAEQAFVLGNKETGGTDLDDRTYPLTCRSVSVGDLLKIVDPSTRRMTFLAVASVGFTEIPEPVNHIVSLEVTDGGTAKVAS